MFLAANMTKAIALTCMHVCMCVCIDVMCMCTHAPVHRHKDIRACRTMWTEAGYAKMILQQRPVLELNCLIVTSS